MESKIASSLKLAHHPVALIWADEKPDTALQFKKETWGCVMWMYARATNGKTAVFDRETYGCVGGGVGLGFGNTYDLFPGSMECFYNFLSVGNEHHALGRKLAHAVKKFAGEDFGKTFLRGERFMKSPHHVRKFLELLPMVDIPNRYVIFKPLSAVDEGERPVVVSFVVNPHQLAALTTLYYYEADTLENVIIAKGAACHQIGILAYREASSEHPRAVVGLTDLFARRSIRQQLGDDIMTFSVPFPQYEVMEAQVEGSFLQEETWEALTRHEPPVGEHLQGRPSGTGQKP
jgi:uncharacterized protein (DUF169 family)